VLTGDDAVANADQGNHWRRDWVAKVFSRTRFLSKQHMVLELLDRRDERVRRCAGTPRRLGNRIERNIPTQSSLANEALPLGEGAYLHCSEGGGFLRENARKGWGGENTLGIGRGRGGGGRRKS